MSSVTWWRARCIAEDQMVDIYSVDAPTLCPNNHADRTLDLSQIYVAGSSTITPNASMDPLPGNYQITTLPLTIPTGATNSVSVHDFTWPMTLLISKLTFMSGSEHIGDSFCISTDPNKAVGTLSVSANAGDTVLNLSPSTFAQTDFTCGVEVIIGDPDTPGSSESLGRIVGMNRTAYTVTVETPLINSYPVGTNFRINMCIIKDLIVGQVTSYVIDFKNSTAKQLDPNAKLRVSYTNSNGQAKNVHILSEYMYY